MAKVVNRGGKWFVEGAGETWDATLGPFDSQAAAEKAMSLRDALVVKPMPDQGTRSGSEDPARRGAPPADAFSWMRKIPLSPDAQERLLEREGPTVDMSLDAAMARLQELGGPRKASHGEPGTSGQGRFGQSEEERRRLEDQASVKILGRLRAQSLRDALLKGGTR